MFYRYQSWKYDMSCVDQWNVSSGFKLICGIYIVLCSLNFQIIICQDCKIFLYFCIASFLQLTTKSSRMRKVLPGRENAIYFYYHTS